MNEILGIQPTLDVARKPAFPPPQPPNVPTSDRLALPYQRVKLVNTDPMRTHIMIDRHMQGHTLQPGGGHCEIEMITSDIESLLNLAKPNRGFYTSGPDAGKPFPPHPVKLEGLTAITTDPKPEERPVFAGAPVTGQQQPVSMELPVRQQPASMEPPVRQAGPPSPLDDRDRRNQQPRR